MNLSRSRKLLNVSAFRTTFELLNVSAFRTTFELLNVSAFRTSEVGVSNAPKAPWTLIKLLYNYTISGLITFYNGSLKRLKLQQLLQQSHFPLGISKVSVKDQ